MSAIISKSVATVGTISYTTGKFGNCLISDGTTGNIGQVEGFAMTTNTPYTVTCWIKTTSTAIPDVIVNWTNVYIAVNAGKLRVNYSSSGNLAGTTTINDGVWHHIEVSWSDSGCIAFVDGVQQLTNALVSMNPPIVGAFVYVMALGSGSLYYDGSLDDLALWNGQLHTTNFTPPTAQADTSDPNLVAVAQFEAAPTDVADGTVHISPNNAAIVYSPYTWNVTSTTATTIDTGAYFKVCFTGQTITLKFDIQYNFAPYNQIYVRVDGVNYNWQKFTLANTIVVTMPTDTGLQGFHFLEVYVKSATSGNMKWNGLGSAIKFKGLILQTNLKTVSAPQRQSYNILGIGDSITEGANSLNPNAADPNDATDGMASWCNQLQVLGAEVGIVGFSAVGVNRNGGYGVPAVVNSYNFLYSGVSRSFSPVPDAIVINLGTNDISSVLTPMTTLLNNLLTATSNSSLIFVLLPFNGGGSAATPTILQAAIAACNVPSKVIYVDTTGFMPTGGATDGLHPAAWAATAVISPKVQQAIRPYLNAKRRGFSKMYS